MARHKHWPVDHPRFESAPWCDLPTKKACDERFSAVRKAEKAAYEAQMAERREQDRTAGERAFNRFNEQEALRVAQVLQWSD